jgi:Phage ABA sandwich domain
MKQYKKDILKSWWNDNLDYLPLGAKYRGKWQKGQVKRMIKEIDNRSLDIEVAERIFGYKVEIIEVTEYHDFGGQTDYPELGYYIWHKEHEEEWETAEVLPHYSTEIQASWKIVEKHGIFSINFEQSSEGPDSYYVRLYNDNYVRGSTASEAICLAVLKFYKDRI